MLCPKSAFGDGGRGGRGGSFPRTRSNVFNLNSEHRHCAMLCRCRWLAKCRTGSGSADLSMGGFLGLLLILLVLWLGYLAFSAYIRCFAWLLPLPFSQSQSQNWSLMSIGYPVWTW